MTILNNLSVKSDIILPFFEVLVGIFVVNVLGNDELNVFSRKKFKKICFFLYNKAEI